MPELKICTAAEQDVLSHLLSCDQLFIPPLSSRVDIAEYAKKLVHHSKTFEVWVGDELVGLVAAYCNDPSVDKAFITNVSVLSNWAGQGLANRLMSMCLECVMASGLKSVELEVGVDNSAAIALYRKHGFSIISHKDSWQKMAKKFGSDI